MKTLRTANRWRSFLALGGLSAGMLYQSTCFLNADFDPILLFAEVGSTFLTDTLFFALDSWLFSIS